MDDRGGVDDIDGLLRDAFGNMTNLEEENNGLNEDAKRFYKLVDEAGLELYPNCTIGFSRLSFIIRLYHLKCLHGWSNTSFTSLLELLKEAITDLNIPTSSNKAKNMVKDLGLDYENIDACPNDYMLYWNEYINDSVFHICRESRYNQTPTMEGNEDDFALPNKVHKVAVKTLRYFSLIPRLKRLFMCPNTAEALRWHDKQRLKDGCIRHLADGQAWKNLDTRYLNFSKELHNLSLGFASDGFNPFRTMNVSYSTWPVVLMVYNFPSWMSMKSEYCMLSLLIPGPCSLGNNTDIFLQPLMEELKELWVSGIDTYDSFKGETFQMHDALLWTINDFPAYAMLSGWSTKGKLACPCCNHDTSFCYLKHSQKAVYMDHRRFLPVDHAWRSNKRSFNGKTEFRDPPRMLTGEEVLDMLKSIDNALGKTQSKIDSIIGTLLDIPGKTKDHAKARYDLKEMGIRKNLHPINTKDGKRIKLARACFSMTKGEKSIFCGVLKKTKLLDGSASNISRCVQQEERKLYGYKTHDAHFMLHYLLQIPIKSILPDHVAVPLVRLCSFFRRLCQKEISLEEINGLESEIVETLC
ncbi:uncharacterized protein LOC130939908 [Arachis stenosperma]|uniref:uncharacterized protein LOC130939908 n=1 Tax=Arachis stenosperma TaxID=217475 RepID=UPI0025AC9EFD|nr:uncharacterized protein LOC130939908 [Arachis stenosperma]